MSAAEKLRELARLREDGSAGGWTDHEWHSYLKAVQRADFAALADEVQSALDGRVEMSDRWKGADAILRAAAEPQESRDE